jgi:hypothetical protein
VRPGAESAKGWWEDPRFLFAILLLMALPLLWPTIPPLTDLIGHMGRYRVQLDIADLPSLQSFYDFHWQLIGNLGVDLLMIPLAPLIGLEPAVKIVAISIPVLATIGVFWISSEVHGRISPAAFFALPFIYGHPFMFGFANFALGMSLTLLAFAFWLRLGRLRRYRLRAVLFVGIGLVIWIAHSFAWGVLGLLCFSGETVRRRDDGLGWAKAAWVSAIQCLSLTPPVALMLFWRSSGAEGETGAWFNWALKFLWLRTTLRDRWQVFDLLALTAALGTFCALVLHKDFRFSRNLGASAFILAIAFFCLPKVVFGSAYADMRLLPYVILIALLAIRPNNDAEARSKSIVAILGLVFVVTRMAGVTTSFFLYDRMHTRTLAALDHVPCGARLVTFVGREEGLPWFTDRQEHISAMAIVRRAAFSNDQWVMKGAQLLSIRKSDASDFDRDPSQLLKIPGEKFEPWHTTDQALQTFPRNAFDYVWLITPHAYDPHSLRGLVPIWRDRTDTLFRVARGPQDSNANSETPNGKGTCPIK